MPEELDRGGDRRQAEDREHDREELKQRGTEGNEQRPQYEGDTEGKRDGDVEQRPADRLTEADRNRRPGGYEQVEYEKRDGSERQHPRQCRYYRFITPSAQVRRRRAPRGYCASWSFQAADRGDSVGRGGSDRRVVTGCGGGGKAR